MEPENASARNGVGAGVAMNFAAYECAGEVVDTIWREPGQCQTNDRARTEGYGRE